MPAANSSEPALLDLRATGAAQKELHERAREARNTHFGNRIFVRGVIEVSNYCRENCAYCGMRRDNKSLRRYRLGLNQLVDLLLGHRPASITDINIQTGEDPVALREVVLPLLTELRRHTNLGLSVCLGTHSESDYAALRDAGADYYIMKIETGDEAHYHELQSPGNLHERLAAIRHLAAAGWQVSSGLIAGLPGQNESHLLATLRLMQSLPLAGWSVSPFIPGGFTPLADHKPASLDLTLNCVALMRLLSPLRVIPAVSAMTIDNPTGYVRALNAGANLATINLTPPAERDDYLLYKRDRQIMTEQLILCEIEAAGCEPNAIGLSRWLADRQPKATATPS